MQSTANEVAPGPRLYYRAREVAQLTGLGLRTVYEGIHAGWIPSRKLGNARLISAAWLRAATDREAERIAVQEREHSQKIRVTAAADADAEDAKQATSQSTSILRQLGRALARRFAAHATRFLRPLRLTQRSVYLLKSVLD